MKLKSYYIDVERPETFCATRKPLADVCDILKRDGLTVVTLPRRVQQNRVLDMINLGYTFVFACVRFICVHQGSVLLLQHPRGFFCRPVGFRMLRALVTLKRMRLVTLIHDVDDLRYDDAVGKNSGISILSKIVDLSQVIIVHNSKMKDLFRSRGVPDDRIVSLECFDYLTTIRRDENDNGNLPLKNTVVIAGNLDAGKAGYLTGLSSVEGVDWQLFGPNYDEQKVVGSNVHYNGVVAPELLTSVLKGDFGLVWDGVSIETCSGALGEYLRINNPHKLSLYLASGLPVVVWAESAVADFVLREKVGIVVYSLCELPSLLSTIDEKNYASLKHNASIVGRRLHEGYYTQKAFRSAINRIAHQIFEKSNDDRHLT